MKASELRIGNFIQTDYEGILEVININSEGFDYVDCRKPNFKALGRFEVEVSCNPIPLTEEWLIKFGFVSNSYQDRYENKAIHVECNKTRGFTELWIERMPHIKYVHQLQNLYFALTGEELTLTEPCNT